MEDTKAAWKADVDILAAEHRKLRAVIFQLAAPSGAQAHRIRGVAAHDLYHAGQIRLLRKAFAVFLRFATLLQALVFLEV